MKKLSNTLKSLWKDESAQGATEYILLLVVVVSIAFIFKDRIKQAVNGRLTEIDTGLSSFGVDRQ